MVTAHPDNVEALDEPYRMAPSFPVRYHILEMCTVSWLHQRDGYILLCNRDERRTRKPASGPRIAGGVVRYIAPVDGDHGGSWIGVNHLGLTLCLLNRYGKWRAEPDRDYTSRGLLLTALLELEAQERVREQIA